LENLCHLFSVPRRWSCCLPVGAPCPHWLRVPGCQVARASLPRPGANVKKGISNSEHLPAEGRPKAD